VCRVKNATICIAFDTAESLGAFVRPANGRGRATIAKPYGIPLGKQLWPIEIGTQRADGAGAVSKTRNAYWNGLGKGWLDITNVR